MAKAFENRGGLFDKKGSAPLLLAHRGYTNDAPENTLVSFLHAAKRHFWAIETDVHLTLDGILVCCHNSSLKKMYGSDVKIEEHTLKELYGERVTAGNCVGDYTAGEMRLPLFDEYLDICRKSGCVPFIETKKNVVEETLFAVKKFDLVDHAVLSSVDFTHIETARALNKDIFVHHIFSTEELMEKISDFGYGGLSYNYPDLDEVPAGLIERTHEAGVRLCLRAGDSRETADRMIEMGLDYIPTNKIAPSDFE